MIGTILGRSVEPGDLIAAFELQDGMFEQAAIVSFAFFVTSDEFFTSFFRFHEADDVQQFAVKSFVEAVAVVGKRQLKQMFGREQFKQGDEHIVIFAVVIAQWLLIVLYVEIRKYNICRQFRHKRLCDLLVEKIRIASRQSSSFKVLKLLYQLFILCKQPVKQRCIEDVPLIDVGDDEVFYFEVFVGDTFAEVVEDEFVEGFGIKLFRRHHLRLIGWFFRFYYHSDTRRCIRPIVDHQVISSFCIDEMILFVIRIL